MKLNKRAGMVALGLAGILAACTSADTTPKVSANPDAISNSCIDPRDISKQTITSDQEIRFELRNGETWVNSLPRVCPGLKFRQGFTWDVRGTLVCSNQQTIYVKDEGTPCTLGVFSKAPPSVTTTTAN